MEKLMVQFIDKDLDEIAIFYVDNNPNFAVGDTLCLTCDDKDEWFKIKKIEHFYRINYVNEEGYKFDNHLISVTVVKPRKK